MPTTFNADYEKVPLRSDEIKVGIVQSRVKVIDDNNPVQGVKDNLDHMIALLDMVQMRDRKDLVAFHEFPIGGFNFMWNREQVLKIALEIPGEETERIAAKAKQYNCYIEFGCYAKLPDWPGHFFNMGVIIDPKGEIVLKRWKTRNLAGLGFSTTIYDVLDEYIERYGADALFPVARTDIGNLGIIPEVLEPEMGRAYAMQGAEIMIRYMTLGSGLWRVKPLAWVGANNHHSFRLDLQAQCMAGHFYGLFVNDAITTENEAFTRGQGHSAIFDPNGCVMIEAASDTETMLTATLPMASYRQEHSVPNFPKEIYQPLYDAYVPRTPANSFKEGKPDGNMAAVKHYADIARW